MLWLALHLPHLPLEVFPACQTPSAIVCRERVVVTDEAGAAAGIRPGMRLAAAWALLPALSVRERAPEREAAALAGLACWAGTFTSEVCLLPQGLLLEIGASLRLFGGSTALYDEIRAGCAAQGFQAVTALAPTPRAAQWLALAGESRPCPALSGLAERLTPLPLGVLELPPRAAARLTAFGARRLGDLLQLPRAGLERRLGAGLGTLLGQALGELPDLRERFVFPEHFSCSLELPGRVEDARALAFAGRRLLAILGGWLLARAAGVAGCVFELQHAGGLRSRPPTLLVLGFSGPTRDPERMGRVLSERLQRFSLEAPVEALRLRADYPAPLGGREQQLFPGGGAPARGRQEAISILVEGLQARLGCERVHGFRVAADYRPENASRVVAPCAGEKIPFSSLPAGPEMRPLWLLERQESLREREGRPWRAGPLQLLAGPERIESGWWDEDEPTALGDVRRDYFVARSAQGEWLWIFRDAEGWFLHGFFA